MNEESTSPIFRTTPSKYVNKFPVPGKILDYNSLFLDNPGKNKNESIIGRNHHKRYKSQVPTQNMMTTTLEQHPLNKLKD